MSMLMGGISREQGVLCLCVNVCILITVYDTWINELSLICPAVFVCVCVSQHVHVSSPHSSIYWEFMQLIYVPQASTLWTLA